MTGAIVSVIFEGEAEARYGVTRLRQTGFPDDAITVIRRYSATDYRDEVPGVAHHNGSGALKGLGVGASVGTAFGLTAVVIPGAGPFIAAGSFIAAFGALGGAVAAGAFVGGAAGGVAGALMSYGISREEAGYHEARIREGGIWVAVDTCRTIQDADTAAGILHAAGGISPISTRDQKSALL